MSQDFPLIPATQSLSSSREPLTQRDDAAASNFSGTAFPTTNLLVGMLCHRTDQGKIYSLKDLTPTWIEVLDVGGASGLAPRATQLQTARGFSITGDVEAESVTFNGTGPVALNTTLTNTGVTAGTYPKVTVNAKGRVTGGAALLAGDIPANLTPDQVKMTGAPAVTLASTDNAIQVGSTASTNMVFDTNDIQVRNNGAAAGLRLNILGGNVTLGDGLTSTLILDGDIGAGSTVLASIAEAEAGTATNRLMTPARVKNAIDALSAQPVMSTFTASGTWTKPSGYSADTPVTVEAWGGGGGGAGYSGNNVNAGGGGGGAYAVKTFRFGDLPATVAVTIGAGGAAGTNVRGGEGATGGNTTFGSLLTAYGGGGGSTENAGGSGGGELAAGLRPSQGSAGGAVGGGNAGATAYTIHGGGGGGGPSAGGGHAVYGGGGGGGGWNTAQGTPGYSKYGGSGGAGGNNTTNATDGTAPGGGGGGAWQIALAKVAGAGARGELRVRVG